MLSPLSTTSRSSAKLFGIPVGDLGFFANLLIAVALGFITFFGVTFLSIFSLLIYNSVAHHRIGMDVGYKYVAFPAGIVVLVVSLALLVGLWARNRLTGQRGA